MAARTVVAVDVGTHTILAAAGRLEEGTLRILEDRQWFARLGEGVRTTGMLREDAIERALAALREVRAMADTHRAEIVAVGTRACREARNSGVFRDAARETLGIAIEVVAGEREAALTFRGASSGLAIEGAATYVDVGGGSTEVIDAEGPAIRAAVSLPIGAVALTERHLCSDPYAPEEVQRVRDAVRADLGALPFAVRPVVVGIGGTATTFAALERGLTRYDGSVVHGTPVSRRALERRLAALAAMTAGARRSVPGLPPERAEVIVAGGTALSEILLRGDAEDLVVSDRGVRHGALLDRLTASV